MGIADSASDSGENALKLYCARCGEIYDHNIPGGNYIDGAFFGTTFPHLFFQTFRELKPGICFFSPTHPFLPYVAPHFSHISPFILVFSKCPSR